MPCFDFQCTGKCHQTFEVVLMAGEEDPGKCPNCGSPQIKKLFNFTCKLNGLTRKSQPDEQPEIDLVVVRHAVVGIG